MKIKSIFFFPNGNTAVFGEDGKQLAQFQDSWMLKHVDMIRCNGGEVDDSTEIRMPNRSRARLFKTSEGENWEIID